MEKILDFVKEYWTVIAGAVLFCIIFYLALGTLGSGPIKQWAARPIQSMVIEDLVILVIIHAWISRSEIKVKK